MRRLNDVLPSAMERLNERAAALHARLAEYRNLLNGKLEDPTMVYLGDNYFASMPVKEAKAFLTRRIESFRSELSTLDQLSGKTEDGLPIFDIVEELDEDGQVVKSDLKRTGFGMPADHEAGKKLEPDSALKDDEQPIQGEHKPLGQLPDAEARALHANGKLANSPPAVLENDESEYEHVETSEALHDHDIQYIEDVTAAEGQDVVRVSEDTSQGEYRDIDPADVLELELMEDSDEENVDFDFDHIEEEEEGEGDANHFSNSDDDNSDFDDDEDDNDENFAFGWKGGSLFPQDEATLKLIQAHLAQQNAPPAGSHSGPSEDLAHKVEAKETPVAKAAKSSHVHFAETVDVREFETSASERKGVIYDRKPSRFSLARNKARAPSQTRDLASPAASASPPRATSAAAAAAAAAGALSGGAHSASPARSAPGQSVGSVHNAVHGAVRERGSPASHPVASPTGNRRRGVPPPTAAAAATKSPASSPKTFVHKSPAASTPQEQSVDKQSSKNAKSPEPRSASHKPMTPPKSARLNEPPHVPSPSKKEKIAEGAQKYYEESFIPDIEFLKLHDTEDGKNDAEHALEPATPSPLPKQANPKSAEGKSEQQDRPVVSSVVTEREPESSTGYDADDSDDHTPDMREIKHEYQRLRQKLIYESGGFKKKDSEKAIEPIEESGVPKKVSRFKAARVAS